MSDLRQAAQQALEALEDWDSPVSLPAITALRAALAQQAEPVEPVATVTECEACFTPDVCQLRGTCDYYTASQMRIAAPPQQAEPVEPVQQPYCYVYEYDGAFGLHREFYPKVYNGHKPDRTVPVYTAPPQRKPLTSDKDRPDQGATYVEGYGYVDTRAVRAVERAHGIGDSDE